MSSPPKAVPPRSAGSWISLYRSERFGGHSWVVSIPKKVIPTSVRRSRLKRLVREAMRSAGLVPETAETWKLVIKRDPPKDIRMNEVASVLAKLAESKKC